MYPIWPLKFCISMVFNFSWDGCNTQEKKKSKIMEKFFFLGGGGGGGVGANKVHYGRCAMGYIHILCVKRKLFSSKKEHRLHHHSCRKHKRLHHLFFLLPLVPCASSSVTRVSRSPLLAITMKKSKCLRRGERVGRERMWRQVFSPCGHGMN